MTSITTAILSIMKRKPAVPAITAVLLCCSALPAEIRSLTILHTNDLHARLSPLENRHGGFAYLASVIARERANCSDCILLNAGDLVQGTPVSTVYRGLPVFEIGNMFGYDAATLGNHDFDYGWQQTKKFVDTATYPIVSSNIANASGELLQPPYAILKVNGLRIAILGAMTEELKTLSSPKLLEQWHTLPLLATLRKYAAELHEKSDLIVVLGHITEAEENQILQFEPEIPVVVSGHVHRGLEM
ncbi:MAG: 5-nucleotidase / UDP-sugar diphosphatase, partial [Bryobacterales bacterium]|nr:5-nucleotidase / UDP-sugar diphosphatase [Bryobacterales bacterium]